MTTKADEGRPAAAAAACLSWLALMLPALTVGWHLPATAPMAHKRRVTMAACSHCLSCASHSSAEHFITSRLAGIDEI
jgi:hypothetical protein